MIEIFRHHDNATVGHLQNLLESEGIKTYYRNEYVSTAAIAVQEFTPALCILNDADLDRSVELIRNYIEALRDEPVAEITCQECGESSPGTFATCWNCGASLTDEPNPNAVSD
jgi:hypothetical protein